MLEGEKRGHHFYQSHVKSKKTEYRLDADFDFLVDVNNFPFTLKSGGNWRKFNIRFIQEIAKTRPFVHFVNAYSDVCNLPYLPCSGENSNNCSKKEKLGIVDKLVIRDFSTDCFAYSNLARSLNLNSKINVYVSPLHKKIIENLHGFKNSNRSFILRPTINTDVFNNMNLKRDIKYLFVGVISEAKGFYEIRDKFYNEDIYFAGAIHPKIDLDFGTYLGIVPYKDIPVIMNRAENFVFLPRWPEPQGRVVAEAALCGCSLITNENVGAASFDFDLSNPLNYTMAEIEFWEKIEEVFA